MNCSGRFLRNKNERKPSIPPSGFSHSEGLRRRENIVVEASANYSDSDESEIRFRSEINLDSINNLEIMEPVLNSLVEKEKVTYSSKGECDHSPSLSSVCQKDFPLMDYIPSFISSTRSLHSFRITSKRDETRNKRKKCSVLNIFKTIFFLFSFGANFGLVGARIRSGNYGDPMSNIRHVLPELELGNNSVTDVSYNLGTVAFLPCRFPSFPRHHENRVSWIRRNDWHILTAGMFTYTNDNRFVVLHKDGTNDWTLQIKFVNNMDNGTYECQVHSGSGFLSQFVNLHVITPRAVILEPRTLTVKSGENFSLTCVIKESLEPPVYVMWLHAGTPVNYAADRPRLVVELDSTSSTTQSVLSVRDAKYTDSGNYTCTAPNAVTSYVLVYVTEGDTVAAVQRRHPDGGSAGGKKDNGGTKKVVASSAVVVSSPSPPDSNSGAGLRPSSFILYPNTSDMFKLYIRYFVLSMLHYILFYTLSVHGLELSSISRKKYLTNASVTTYKGYTSPQSIFR